MANTKTNSATFSFSLIDPELKLNVPSYNESSSNNNNTYIYWGDDNRFPNKLLELAENSSSLSAILNGTSSFICGNAIRFKNEHSVFKDVDLTNLVGQLAYDKILYGGYAIQVIYNRFKKVAELHPIPLEYIRTNEENTKFWYNKKWGKYSVKSIVYDAYNPDNVDDRFTQVFYRKNSGTRRVYPTSPQTGALNDIVSENVASKYVKNSLESGLSARWIVNIPNAAKLTDEMKAKIEEGIKRKFTGVENAGGFMIYFNNSEAKLDITKLDIDNANDIFNSIRKEAKNNIFVVNQATPNLFGSPTETTGFSEQEYDSAYKLYYRLVVYPIQKQIVDDLSMLFGEEIEIEPFDLNVKDEENTDNIETEKNVE